MGIGPLFSYFGAKHSSACKYPAPQYDKIIEPFAGSAAYACEYPSLDVDLYDKDPKLSLLWEYLIGVSGEEILGLPDVKAGQSIKFMDLTDDQRALLGFWVGKGRPTTGNTPTKFSSWGESTRVKIAAAVAQIRHWDIYGQSYETIPNEEATWFVDPPYQNMGKHYRYGTGQMNFKHLADWCRSRKGQVIVCENAGADWLPFEHFAESKSQLKGKTSSEVIWTQENYRSP